MPDILIRLGIFLPTVFSLAVWNFSDAERARRWTAGSLAGSFSLFLIAGFYFPLNALGAVSLPLFAGLCLGTAVLAPKQDVSPRWFAGLLWLSAATSVFYAAGNPAGLAAGWGASIIPFLIPGVFSSSRTMPFSAKAALALSFLFLCVGLGLLAYAGGDPVLSSRAFFVLLLAVAFREGLIPFFSWPVSAFSKGPLLPVTILASGHLGVFLLARVVALISPEILADAQPSMRFWGLGVLVYAAARALVVQNPRRLFGLLSMGQGALLLIGMASPNLSGLTGAFVLWQVCAVSMTMMACVYSGLEARAGAALEKEGFLGLAYNAPRLAVFFAGAALSLAGLPLTFGFFGGELLMTGAFAADKTVGMVLPAAAALDGFILLRFFMRLFFGRPGAAALNLPDALPRERWVLTAALLFLAAGGLFPSGLLHFPEAAAESLLGALSSH